MNASVPVVSTIVGDIHPSDYVSASRRMVIRPPWMRFAGPLIGIGAITIMILGIRLLSPEEERSLIRMVMFPVVLASMAFLVVCLKVITRASRSYFQHNAVVPNMGIGTYEIIGNDLHFSGTMYDCTVPIRGIKEIATVEGVTILVLSNAASFVIPRIITSGDLPEFLAQLRARMSAPAG